MFKDFRNRNLKKLIDEKDREIKELKKQNRELANELAKYSDLEGSIEELTNQSRKSKTLNKQFRKINRDYKDAVKGYKRDMDRLLKSI
ncbi:MAG: hypothetical protein MSA59_05285 [Lachnobacterium sp.]|nr:hypothetical protein [Lachnobacterium sp.]